MKGPAEFWNQSCNLCCVVSQCQAECFRTRSASKSSLENLNYWDKRDGIVALVAIAGEGKESPGRSFGANFRRDPRLAHSCRSRDYGNSFLAARRPFKHAEQHGTLRLPANKFCLAGERREPCLSSLK